MARTVEKQSEQKESLVSHGSVLKTLASSIQKAQQINATEIDKEVSKLNDNRNAPPPKEITRQLFQFINQSVLDKDPETLATAKSLMPSDTQTTFIEKKKIIRSEDEEKAVPWTKDELRKLAH